MTVYVGVDPGIKGALALLDDNVEVIQTWKMPLDKARKFCPIETWKVLREIDNIAADRFDSVSCCIEGLLSLPSDTNKITLMIKMVEKNPTPELFENLYQELKKTDGRVGSVTGPTAKIRSYNFVKTIFPEIDVSKRGGGFDNDLCDALCIAYYCRKKLSV